MAVLFEGSEVPPPLAEDYAAFRDQLREGGIRAALAFLNARTPHRFTGIFRFDRHMLRNVALVDKWDPSVQRGDDVPLAEAYCSILHATGEPFEILDRASDTRHPQLAVSPIASYCGVLITGEDGERFGALCHYDLQPCQVKTSDMPLLVAAAAALGVELTAMLTQE